MRKFTRIFLTLTLSLLLTLLVAPTTFAQDNNGTQVRITQVDNSNFPQVTVYVSVTDASGQPVGVDPSSIQLFENGQLMQTNTVNGVGGQQGPGQLTTLLVMDVSGSMENGNKIDGAKQAAQAYVDQMRPGDQAGVVAFNTDVNVVQDVTSDHQALTKAIDSLKPLGNTAMFDALISSEKLLDNVSGRKAIILLSDGIDNKSKSVEDDVINAIGPAGLTISTIGLGDPKEAGNNFGLDEDALKSMAQRAGGIYSFETDPQALESIYQQYGRTLQSEYAFTYTSPSTLRDGVNRSLTVSLNGAASASSQYNPGGVLPEVAGQSWMLFGGILVGLLILLFIPMLLGGLFRGGGGGGSRKKGRVKLQNQPKSSAHGRVKMR